MTKNNYVLYIWLNGFFFSFTKKMSELNTKKELNLYYPIKNFTNKKWVKRRNIFERKKNFIEKVNAVWKVSVKLKNIHPCKQLKTT